MSRVSCLLVVWCVGFFFQNDTSIHALSACRWLKSYWIEAIFQFMKPRDTEHIKVPLLEVSWRSHYHKATEPTSKFLRGQANAFKQLLSPAVTTPRDACAFCRDAPPGPQGRPEFLKARHLTFRLQGSHLKRLTVSCSDLQYMSVILCSAVQPLTFLVANLSILWRNHEKFLCRLSTFLVALAPGPQLLPWPGRTLAAFGGRLGSRTVYAKLPNKAATCRGFRQRTMRQCVKICRGPGLSTRPTFHAMSWSPASPNWWSPSPLGHLAIRCVPICCKICCKICCTCSARVRRMCLAMEGHRRTGARFDCFGSGHWRLSPAGSSGSCRRCSTRLRSRGIQ